MKIIRPRHNPERVRLTSRGLSCGLTLTNGGRLVADIDERELRGIKETYATKYETPHPDKPQRNAQSGEKVKPKSSLKSSYTRPQQGDQRSRSKGSQRNID